MVVSWYNLHKTGGYLRRLGNNIPSARNRCPLKIFCLS